MQKLQLVFLLQRRNYVYFVPPLPNETDALLPISWGQAQARSPPAVTLPMCSASLDGQLASALTRAVYSTVVQLQVPLTTATNANPLPFIGATAQAPRNL